MSTYDMMPAPCPAFVWIGQPFGSCDECGKPYWEHTHERIPYTRTDGTYRIRLRSISRAKAHQVEQVWGRHWGSKRP